MKLTIIFFLQKVIHFLLKNKHAFILKFEVQHINIFKNNFSELNIFIVFMKITNF